MTFRTVPMADGLKSVLQGWLKEHHPGGALHAGGSRRETVRTTDVDESLPIGP